MQAIQDLIKQGEGIGLEFKSSLLNSESLAKEFVAFSNSYGGTLLIGVQDDGEIEESITIDEEWVQNIARQNIIPPIQVLTDTVSMGTKKVLKITIPKGSDKPYQTLSGKFYIRAGSTNRQASKEELGRLFQESGLIHFDTIAVQNTSIVDLDGDKLTKYWNDCYQIAFGELSDGEKIRILRNSDIIHNHKKEEKISLAGMLIFGKTPQKHLRHTSIKFAVFSGLDRTTDLLDKKEITGTLDELVDKALGLTLTYVANPSSGLSGGKRIETPAVSQKTIRELIVNAIAHRDYSILNQFISIYKFMDRIEITSPGKLPNTLTLEKIRFGNSAPRNIALVRFLDNLRYIDVLGRGIPSIIQELQDRVHFQEEGQLFKVTVFL